MDGVDMCIFVFVVCMVGKLMKIWFLGFLLGRIEVKILVVLFIMLLVFVFLEVWDLL